MKKTLLALSLLLACTGSAMAQKKAAPAKKPATAATQKAVANTISCTIDGKAYSASGDSKVLTVAKLKTYKDPPYLEVEIFSNPSAPVYYSVTFYLAPDARLEPGTYALRDIMTYETTFPSANISVTKQEPSISMVSSFEEGTTGAVTVTSVAGGVIEGTFECKVDGITGKADFTNGSFRFRMPPIEKK